MRLLCCAMRASSSCLRAAAAPAPPAGSATGPVSSPAEVLLLAGALAGAAGVCPSSPCCVRCSEGPSAPGAAAALSCLRCSCKLCLLARSASIITLSSHSWVMARHHSSNTFWNLLLSSSAAPPSPARSLCISLLNITSPEAGCVSRSPPPGSCGPPAAWSRLQDRALSGPSSFKRPRASSAADSFLERTRARWRCMIAIARSCSGPDASSAAMRPPRPRSSGPATSARCRSHRTSS
mmetsp:Transcript_20515/g.44868  ORF Transcript_20515/g.44868 Transcript_20515/m.44868 type:complete len:237 (-) Transcript_20515:1807-2517(-)